MTHNCTDIVPYSKQLPLSTKRKKCNYSKYFAIVPYWWYEWLMQWPWHAQKNNRTMYAHTGSKKTAMHRVVMGVYDPKVMIDHINHDGLENTHRNLRLSTNMQNQCNSLKQKNRSSIYKGVSFYKNKRRFVARIVNTRFDFFLGMYKDEVAAAKAYDAKAKELYGEFANLNFPDLNV